MTPLGHEIAKGMLTAILCAWFCGRIIGLWLSKEDWRILWNFVASIYRS